MPPGSDAVGAAQVQLGPEALALAAHLNKEMGISHQRVARARELGYGLAVNRSTLCRTWLRVAIRQSPINWLDETGWRVAASLKWLWVALSRQVTVNAILPGRGFPQAAELLGEDYAGFLHHDGWRPCCFRALKSCFDANVSVFGFIFAFWPPS